MWAVLRLHRACAVHLVGAGVVAALYDCGAPGLRGELRRRGEHPDGVAVSFVKVVELQARGIPHYHAVIQPRRRTGSR